ncbi:MAG: phosphoribosylanthranilate isomerase [Chlamydiota bacterium]
MPLIKICGVTDPETAQFAAEQGADFIGIVFAASSKRCVSVPRGKEIADAARSKGAVPVGIFVEHAAEEIIAICSETQIACVQAYRNCDLPAHLARFYLSEASPRKGVDFLLMESDQPGTGKTVDWECFVPPAYAEWFLAGGLDSENVEDAIARFHPFGVDVSSGVERAGKKEKELIEKFIRKVRRYE